MEHAQLNSIANFIWGIADDVLRDVYVRGKYRDIILPMTVLRRLDAVLEPTKSEVMKTKTQLDEAGITNQDQALRMASGQALYNTSPFTMRDLKARTNQQQMRADFEAYLDGFSPNVQDILENFEFRNQIPRLSKADVLGTLFEKFLSPDINLSPNPVGRHDGLDNHGMGTIFEELVRRFNEDNNEEAGQHWTPRDAVDLMARLIFLPIADQIKDAPYLLYDGACGTGGMLTVAEEVLQRLAAEHGKQVSTHLFGQEITAEIFAICKADLLLKGEGEAADNIVGGAEYSTLANDAFAGKSFDFMLSNPPYGKSWKSDLERMGGKGGIRDTRFIVDHAGDPEFSLLTRSSDGQLLFLANMLSKMKDTTELGSRIAEVHNGSSLFTGDAGQGESNIRRWIIENDWLEAIVALPLNMFYNTGIATYVWVLTNRKPEHRRGKVQLIDASKWFEPFRKNMGKKNCRLADADIQRICQTFLDFKETEESKIFPNKAFGYWKVTVDRPLRLRSKITRRAVESLRFSSGDESLREQLYEAIGEDLFDNFDKVQAQLTDLVKNWGKVSDEDDEDSDTKKAAIPAKKQEKLLKRSTWERDGRLVAAADALLKHFGDREFPDHNEFRQAMDAALNQLGISLSAGEKKLIWNAASTQDESVPAVIKKIHKKGTEPDSLHGMFETTIDGKQVVIEYEHDTDLRDTEQVPLLEEGGIDAFLQREVLPYAPDAWYDASSVKIGYEISFTRYFYKPQPLRTLEEIQADILALEKETEGLLDDIILGVNG